MDFNFIDTPEILKLYVYEREGCPIHYWLGGSSNKPLIVLMHGAMMDHRMFNAQVEALTAHYQLLVWDGRGHGLSQPLGHTSSLETYAEDMLAILRYHTFEKVVIGGQSWGGYIAQKVYLLAPELVQAMIIIGSTPLTKAYSIFDILALKASLPILRWWPYESLKTVIASATARTKSAQACALDAISQITNQNFVLIWQAVSRSVNTVGDPAHTIDVPLLLLHGQHDTTGSIRRDMPRWAETGEQVMYTAIPKAGHNANQDNPQFTNQILLEFLAQFVE